MCINNKIASLLFKIVIVGVCVTGILMICGFPKNLDFSLMKYYTLQSNVLVLVFFIAAAFHTAGQIRKSGTRGAVTFAPRLKGAVMIAITVTLLVYQFMLAGSPFSMSSAITGDAFVHLFTPLLVILDWLLFDMKGRFTVTSPFWWTIVPLCYIAYAFIAAPLGVTYYGGGRYPYFFFDVDTLGIGTVLLYLVGMTVAFFILSYIFVGLDRLLGRRAKKIIRRDGQLQ
ncbi:MAG: Pr6Pr family membrane protein [Clostridiales Family XIII bacterium]|jgi:hypothetical protein|nr:Pr6Pr family membrane protein [Clostridiales Family XIII bacterium]